MHQVAAGSLIIARASVCDPFLARSARLARAWTAGAALRSAHIGYAWGSVFC
jgi:hypothetical protein